MAPHRNNFYFFRVILPHHIIQNGTLELPRNFVKKHGKHLPMYARLKLPTGSESKIELKRLNGRAWLHKGWPDFVDKYSIKCGYFLVFKYKGGSRFSVLIFDLSTSEIDYLVSSTRNSKKEARESQVIEIKEEDSDDDEISDEYCAVVGATKGVKSERPIDRVLQKPGSFMIYMTRFYVSPKAKVHIPNAHVRRHIKGDKDGENTVILDGSNGKTWPVKYRFCNANSINKSAAFTNGWKEFASDNKLRVGDICYFEMMIHKAKAYKVTISRVADKPDRA